MRLITQLFWIFLLEFWSSFVGFFFSLKALFQEKQVYYTANKLAPYALKPLNIKNRNSHFAASINKDFAMRGFLLWSCVSLWYEVAGEFTLIHLIQHMKCRATKILWGEERSINCGKVSSNGVRTEMFVGTTGW